jgi:serine-type D-Ala-D-Ala carboxypeptidase/endopeptidase (penicillin-binding protein 4)
MNKIIGAYLVAMLFALDIHAARDTSLPLPLARAAKTHSVRMEDLGLYVHVLGEKSSRISHNAEQAMNPASTLKLLTTLAALHVLGPAYVWRTEAYADGIIRNGVLEGNLVLKGSGDPKLTLEEFWLLLRQIRARGVQHVNGDVVLDRTLFEPVTGSPGDFDGDSLRPYNALPDALLVNFNAVRLDFVPDRDAKLVRILMHPWLPQIQIVNKLHLVDTDCGDWPQDPSYDPQSAQLTFHGNYPANCGEKSRNYSPISGLVYVDALFRALWHEIGGTVSGQVKDGVASSAAALIAAQESEPLSEVIRDINKFSNNVMARQLFLSLSVASASPPLNAAKSSLAIQQWLTREQLSFPELVVENGSGLSRLERISSRHLGELLLWAARSPLAPEFIASLPITGIDGTMRKRLNESTVSGRAHMKTGYLSGVRASAGYVQDDQGRLVVVVCLINGTSANESKSFHDAVIEWAYAKARGVKTCCQK